MRREPCLRVKTSKRLALIREIRKNCMKVRETQDFLRAGAQIHGFQIRVILSRGKYGPDQLPDSRTVEIRNIAQVQKNTFPPIPEKIAQQLVHGLAFDQCESSAHVDNRNLADLARAGAETQSVLLGSSGQMILSYAWPES